jgi:hypothetical protein
MNNLYTSVEILGGLGNQLFQLAYMIYFLRLSKKQKIKRKLIFKQDDNVTTAPATATGHYWNTIFKGLFRVIASDDYKNIPFHIYHADLDNNHKYPEPPYKANNEHVFLKGKYQTFKYIDDILRDKMINIVYSNEDIMYSAYYKYRDILNYFGDNTKDNDMVSLHIRRKDTGYILDMSYHEEALRIANKKNVVVFSDDIEWCISNFNDNKYNIYYISDKIFKEEELNSKAEIEFILMSMFKNNIIANSYFSLWASFISYYKTKIVIAPKRWYSLDERRECDEIYHKYITHII